MGWGWKPIPADDNVMTKSLPSMDVALKAKASLASKGNCSL